MQKDSYLGGAAVKTGPLAVSALPPKQQSMKTLFKKKKLILSRKKLSGFLISLAFQLSHKDHS